MDIVLPLAGIEVNLLYLIFFGLITGFTAGLFGIGGGFILVPFLHIVFDIPYDVAAGTSLGMILGTSISGSIKHSSLGPVNYKLGFLILTGSVLGVEGATRILALVKDADPISLNQNPVPAVNVLVPVLYIAVFSLIGLLFFIEGRKTLKNPGTESLFNHRISARITAIPLRPRISFHGLHFNRVSFWIIWGTGICVGFLSGMLGIGGGLVFIPFLIYVLTVPTKSATATNLFGIIFTSAYGVFKHSLIGNVDLTLLLLLVIGSSIGAQLGAVVSSKLPGTKIRYYFSYLVLGSVLAILYKLLHSFDLM